MACTSSSMTMESCHDQGVASGTSLTPNEDTPLLRNRSQRRHSFHASSRRLSCDYDADAVFLRVSTLCHIDLDLAKPSLILYVGGIIPL